MKPVIADGKAFPVLLPIDGRWLNWRDTYGAPRMRFIGGVWKQVGVHQGIDIFAERGSPVVSIAPGTVENVGWTFYSGWRVGVRGSDGRYYFYAHLLQSFAAGIGQGAQVTAGQLLGFLGSSGYGPEGTSEEFPPHLHFGLQERSGSWSNPQEMLKRLYETSVSHLLEARSRVHSADARLTALKSRAYLPGAPTRPELAKFVEATAQERRNILTSLRLG
jgi:murein DD-endopeptidase MepM/ murein hydrolase activator NlpD